MYVIKREERQPKAVRCICNGNFAEKAYMEKTFTVYEKRAIKIQKVSIDAEFLYKSDNRQYTGIPTVTTTGNRIWVAYQTGGNIEPHPENYCILSYSDDDGRSFVPFATVGGMYDGTNTNIFIPTLITDDDGNLLFLFSVKGMYFFAKITNPQGEAESVGWEEPEYIYEGLLIVNKPLRFINSEGKREWLFAGDTDGAEYTTVISATSPDKMKGWTVKGRARTKHFGESANLFHEPYIIRKKDGTLWMLKRLEKGQYGGIEQSFSYDEGKSWTDYKSDLPEPFIGPGSKFGFVTLQSGNILFVNHDNRKSRSRICAYLSEDEGKTWHKLIIDDRIPVSYPEVHQAENGYIYIVYDHGRLKEQEIRIAKICEDDIINGKPGSESYIKRVVTKSPKYRDITAIDGIGEIESLIEDNCNPGDLPGKLRFLDENGDSVVLSGYWEKTETVEKTRYRFVCDMPDGLVDTFGLTKFEKTRVRDEELF